MSKRENVSSSFLLGNGEADVKALLEYVKALREIFQYTKDDGLEGLYESLRKLTETINVRYSAKDILENYDQASINQVGRLIPSLLDELIRTDVGKKNIESLQLIRNALEQLISRMNYLYSEIRSKNDKEEIKNVPVAEEDKHIVPIEEVNKAFTGAIKDTRKWYKALWDSCKTMSKWDGLGTLSAAGAVVYYAVSVGLLVGVSVATAGIGAAVIIGAVVAYQLAKYPLKRFAANLWAALKYPFTRKWEVPSWGKVITREMKLKKLESVKEEAREAQIKMETLENTRNETVESESQLDQPTNESGTIEGENQIKLLQQQLIEEYKNTLSEKDQEINKQQTELDKLITRNASLERRCEALEERADRKALKEVQVIEELKKTIDELRNRNGSLERKCEVLEERVNDQHIRERLLLTLSLERLSNNSKNSGPGKEEQPPRERKALAELQNHVKTSLVGSRATLFRLQAQQKKQSPPAVPAKPKHLSLTPLPSNESGDSVV